MRKPGFAAHIAAGFPPHRCPFAHEAAWQPFAASIDMISNHCADTSTAPPAAPRFAIGHALS